MSINPLNETFSSSPVSGSSQKDCQQNLDAPFISSSQPVTSIHTSIVHDHGQKSKTPCPGCGKEFISLNGHLAKASGPCAEIRSQRSLNSTHYLPRPSPAPQSQNVTIDVPNLISAPRTNLNSVFASNLVQLKQKIKIVKRIPKGTRFFFC